jgi:hypothetical protein
MQQKPAGMREKTYSGATSYCMQERQQAISGVLKNQRKVQQQQMNQQEQKLQQRASAASTTGSPSSLSH